MHQWELTNIYQSYPAPDAWINDAVYMYEQGFFQVFVFRL
jgi:hypothetical protein